MANKYVDKGIIYQIDNGAICKEKTERFMATASGKGFQKKPYQIEERQITGEQYFNMMESTELPIFKDPGHGGYQRVYKGYTSVGYVPVQIVNVGPGREKKIVRTYTFDYKR